MSEEIKLTKDFYDRNKIEQAVLAYSHIAKIRIKEVSEYYYCVISESHYDTYLVSQEFENYVIALMNT